MSASWRLAVRFYAYSSHIFKCVFARCGVFGSALLRRRSSEPDRERKIETRFCKSRLLSQEGGKSTSSKKPDAMRWYNRGQTRLQCHITAFLMFRDKDVDFLSSRQSLDSNPPKRYHTDNGTIFSSALYQIQKANCEWRNGKCGRFAREKVAKVARVGFQTGQSRALFDTYESSSSAGRPWGPRKNAAVSWNAPNESFTKDGSNILTWFFNTYLQKLSLRIVCGNDNTNRENGLICSSEKWLLLQIYLSIYMYKRA